MFKCDEYALWKYNKAEEKTTWNKYSELLETLMKYRPKKYVEKEEPKKNNPYYRHFEKKKRSR